MRPFAPFVRERVNLKIDRAFLETTSKLQLRQAETGEAPLISLQGEAAITDLKTSEAERGKDLLSLQRLGLKGLDFASHPLSVRMEEIELAGLDTQLLLYEDGSSNLQRLLTSQTASGQKGAQSAEKATEAQVMIDRISLSQGRLRFVDERISPAFRSTLSDVQGTITDLGNQGDQPAGVELQADLGSNAPLRLKGKANVLGERFFTDMKLQLANIALSPLSPYSGKYIGYSIDKGKFNLDSTVRIEGEALESDNSLLLDQLNLGEKVDSPAAVNAPVKLGLALLKNRQGEIHIDKSVSGDLSDPEFTVGDLVMRVFVNVLVKAATSPFAILGAMFGGGEDINMVSFAPGQASLSEEAEAKMTKLGKALYERPGLKVDVLGRADTSKDRAALEERRFQQQLREQKYLDLSKKERAETSSQEMRILPEEYEVYLWKAYKEAPLEKPKNALGLTKKLPPEEIEERLRTSVAVVEDDLRQLAAARAKKVLSFLHEAGPVAPERLFLQHPELGTAAGDAYTKVEMRMH
jgi:hypothetical protein